MCQLLGMNSRLPASLTLSFTCFAQRGGATDHHADGWGIAFFESDGLSPGKAARTFVDKESAATSPIARMLRTYPIKSHNVVAHVRKATVGAVTLENCHPFVRELWGRYWVFAHNGDLKDYAPSLHGSYKPVGTTDSELALMPGDLMVLYTDGVIQGMNDRGEQFGMERLKEAMESAPADKDARAVLDHITAAMDAFVGEGVMGDDVTLVCLKIR